MFFFLIANQSPFRSQVYALTLGVVTAMLVFSRGVLAAPVPTDDIHESIFLNYGADPAAIPLMVKYAHCLTSRHQYTRELVGILQAERGSLDEKKRIARLSSPIGCGQMDVPLLHLPHSAIRGTIAEKLYQRWYSKFPADSSRVRLEIASRLPPIANTTLAAVSICLANDYPSQVDELVRTVPGSPEDFSAMRALLPQIETCESYWDEEEWTHVQVRGALAETLFATARTIQPPRWERVIGLRPRKK